MKPKIGDFIKFELKSEDKKGFFKCVMAEIVHDWEEVYVVVDPWNQKVMVRKDMKFRKIQTVFFAYDKKRGQPLNLKTEERFEDKSLA